MQRALGQGDRQGALRIFERLRERLRADLGVGPSVASVALYEHALALDGEEPAVEEHAHALIARALIALNTSALDEAERLASQARSMSLAAGLARETGEASAVLGIAANARWRWPEHFREEFLPRCARIPTSRRMCSTHTGAWRSTACTVSADTSL